MDSRKRSSFYVVLPSNSCSKTQPNNTAGKYIVDYENPLSLEGNWEVALSEFSFSYYPSFTDLQIDYIIENPIISKITLSAMNMLTMVRSKGTIEFGTIYIKLNFLNQLELVNYKTHRKADPFVLKFENSKHASRWGFSRLYNKSKGNILVSDADINFEDIISKKEELNADILFIGYEDKTIFFDKFVITANHDHLRKYVMEHCDSIFRDFRVNQNGFVAFRLNTDIKQITFDAILAFKLGFGEERIFTRQNEFHIAKMKLNMGTTFNQYFIYASIVEPIIIGNSRIPLLRTVWIEPKHNIDDVIHENVDYPMYLPVSNKLISSILIEYKNVNGDYIDFVYGSKSNITLHFRSR